MFQEWPRHPLYTYSVARLLFQNREQYPEPVNHQDHSFPLKVSVKLLSSSSSGLRKELCAQGSASESINTNLGYFKIAYWSVSSCSAVKFLNNKTAHIMTIININSDLKTIQYQSIKSKYKFTYNSFYFHTFFLKEVEVLKYEMALCHCAPISVVQLLFSFIWRFLFTTSSPWAVASECG